MSIGKVMIIHLIVGLIKKILLYKMSYFPEPHKKIEVQSDFFNYTTKSDLKNARDVDTSYFAKNTDLASLKSEVDKLYIGKLKTTPVDISKNTVL